MSESLHRRTVLHIYLLFALAFGPPLFSVLGRDTELFLAHFVEPFDVVLFLFIFSFLAPALFCAPYLLIRVYSEKIARAFLSLLMGMLFALIAYQFFKGILPWSLPATMVSLALGAMGTRIYLRRGDIRRFLTVLSPAILILPFFFVFSPRLRNWFFWRAFEKRAR